jgi:hypothetical protein
VNTISRSNFKFIKIFDYLLNVLLRLNINYLYKIRFNVILTLPSIEDKCLYNLTLNVTPGCYYQLPIPFSIEKFYPDEINEPKYV